MNNPDEAVANIIIEIFRKENLLAEKGISNIQAKLSTGALRAEDWILAFELDRPGKEDDNAAQS